MATTARPLRILIIEDHPVARLGLRYLIEGEADLEVCGEGDHAAEALALLEKTTPDLILIDLSLKGSSGLELIKQISARPRPPAMLVVSMHDEVLFAERALHAGAMGYVNKGEAAETVVGAIRQVIAGKVYLSPHMVDRMLQTVAKAEGQIARPELEVLSDREIEVFELIGEGMSTREIAATLALSVKTIETYRENLKRKLALKSNAELVRRAVLWVLQGP